RLQESVQWVHKAIEVYPQSHFGREMWQAVIEEFLLAVLDNPQLLVQYDMIGNRLDQWVTPPEDRRVTDVKSWTAGPAQRAASYLHNGRERGHEEDFRKYITTVGAEGEWTKGVPTSHKSPAPFDEPTLGIIGMWRMGAGANPYFSLALGEIMLRIGQRYLAWYAFERSALLKDGIWPDPDIRHKFEAQCRKRQAAIERQLPGENWQARRGEFQEKLAEGQRYQQAYQD